MKIRLNKFQLPVQRASEFAQSVGFKWFIGTFPKYDPDKGYAADSLDDLCHELAHFLVSPPHLRAKKWFGLGNPNAANWSLQVGEDKPVFSRNVCDRYEKDASLLGAVLVREFGDRVQKAAFEFVNSGTMGYGRAKFRRNYHNTRRRLKRRGLLTEKQDRIALEILRYHLDFNEF